MTLDSLVPWRQFLFILFPHLKCWPHVFHLCANCIPPETIAIMFVNCIACSTELGIRIPNLCIHCQYLDLILDRILLRFLIKFPTHQAKAGSSSIWLAIAYSATRTGYECFASFRATQLVLPSFH